MGFFIASPCSGSVHLPQLSARGGDAGCVPAKHWTEHFLKNGKTEYPMPFSNPSSGRGPEPLLGSDCFPASISVKPCGHSCTSRSPACSRHSEGAHTSLEQIHSGPILPSRVCPARSRVSQPALVEGEPIAMAASSQQTSSLPPPQVSPGTWLLSCRRHFWSSLQLGEAM